MSMMLMVQAMKAKVGNPLRKLVLIKLADNANDKGECWPSYQHVADQCEIGRSTVKAHIKALEAAGFLSIIERNDGQSSNLYRLCIESGVEQQRTARKRKNDGPVTNEPGQHLTTPGQMLTPTRSNADPLTRSGFDPRTSHSFEAVTEPVIEPLQAAAEAPASAVMVVADPVKPRIDIPADMPGPKDPSAKTFRAWANYAMAYRKRYTVWPAWNAKTAGQVSQLVDRLGADEAPAVAAFYVMINDSRLINDCHSLNGLLARCEAYRTQYLTGRQMTATTARQIEQKQANLTAGEDAAARIRERREAKGKRNEFL